MVLELDLYLLVKRAIDGMEGVELPDLIFIKGDPYPVLIAFL